MLFKGRLSKVLNLKKAERDYQENIDKIQLEKNDLPAMMMAAALVFVPAILAVVAFFWVIIWFVFLR